MIRKNSYFEIYFIKLTNVKQIERRQHLETWLGVYNSAFKRCGKQATHGHFVNSRSALPGEVPCPAQWSWVESLASSGWCHVLYQPLFIAIYPGLMENFYLFAVFWRKEGAFLYSIHRKNIHQLHFPGSLSLPLSLFHFVSLVQDSLTSGNLILGFLNEKGPS